MRVAALIKQVPAFEEMRLGPDGRLERAGLELEMNPYCRRAVSQAVELAAAVGDGTVTVFTLGPPVAEDVLCEAIAWGRAAAVSIDGVLISDPAFAGSDTLATAHALAAALRQEGPFDLVLVGRNSVDADTGQVGPELAELLDLPFATGVRHLSLQQDRLHLRCEYDDGWVQAEVLVPAVVSVAERLIEPCKVPPEERALVPADAIRILGAADLGPGPWGQSASPTSVGSVRVHEVDREQLVLAGPLDEQVRTAVAVLDRRGALDLSREHGNAPTLPPLREPSGPAVAVVAEPDRDHETRELLGAAAELAGTIGGHVVALTPQPAGSHDALGHQDPGLQDPDHSQIPVGRLGSWGADLVIELRDVLVEEDVAHGIADWAVGAEPWAILAPSTAWGREVAARSAARLGAGLTGDAIGLEVAEGRLVAWKPAFGGQLIAAITCSSPVQMATVRAGVLPRPTPREGHAAVRSIMVEPRRRVVVRSRTRDDDLDVLAEAMAVVGIGSVVTPDEHSALDPLLGTLGAVLGATRKVTDRGWLPRARQIGITGRTIAPRLYLAVGISGSFNHMVGVRSAGTILAVNDRPDAKIFAASDVGIVGDWHEVVPLLVAELERVTTPAVAG